MKDCVKEDVERCIQIAERYIQAGQLSSALRYLRFAEKMHHTAYATKLIKDIYAKKNLSESDLDSGWSDEGLEEEPKEWWEGNSASDNAADANRHFENPKPVENEKNDITNITDSKDYYEILGVNKDCTDDDLRKSYKKLALKYHPDKNRIPGATEAFKAISNAFSVLSDPEARLKYDNGDQEDKMADNMADRSADRSADYSHYQAYWAECDENIYAEELFNIFFNSGFKTEGPRVRSYPRASRVNKHTERHRHHYSHRRFNHHHDDDNDHHSAHDYNNRRSFHYSDNSHTSTRSSQPGYAVLVQLGPILFLVVVSLITAFLSAESTYATRQTHKYSTERRTENLGVMYYVKPDFSQTYKGSVQRLESEIEEEYVGNLRSACYREKLYKENLMWQARSYRNQRLYEEAQNSNNPSCDTLQQMFG